MKINQVFSKHNLPPNVTIADSNSNDGEIASTSTDPPVRSGFFTLASMANGLKENKITFKENPPSQEIKAALVPSKIFTPTKVIELPSVRLVKPKSNKISDPLPFKISSIASGEEVTLLTNGFDDNVDDDDDNEDELNTQPQISEVKSLATGQDGASMTKADHSQLDSMLVQTKTEPIDISDDEQPAHMVNSMEPSNNSIVKEPLVLETESRLKGYMYCSTNIQLGKVSIEWIAPDRIKLQLAESVDIECDKSEPFQKNLAIASTYMNKYIRERFYGVYPANLRLDWIFFKTVDIEGCSHSLCEFNKVEPFSVR